MKRSLFFFAVLLGSGVFSLSAQEKWPPLRLSMNYDLSILGLSSNYQGAGSILIWRDIIMHGMRFNADVGKGLSGFEQIHAGAAFAVSSDGYHLDDDANNSYQVISVADPQATVLDLDFALVKRLHENIRFSAGFEFGWAGMKNYNLRKFGDGDDNRKGIINTYELFTLELLGGISARLYEDPLFYFELGGQAGLGSFIGVGNWIYRYEFKHPISFSDMGLFLRGSCETEFGFKFGSFTLFCGLRAFYKIGPLSINLQYLADGSLAGQLQSLELSRASFLLGFKTTW